MKMRFKDFAMTFISVIQRHYAPSIRNHIHILSTCDWSPFFLDLLLLCVHCYKRGSHIPTTVYGSPLKLAFISHRNGSGHFCLMFDTVITSDFHYYCVWIVFLLNIFTFYVINVRFRHSHPFYAVEHKRCLVVVEVVPNVHVPADFHVLANAYGVHLLD